MSVENPIGRLTLLNSWPMEKGEAGPSPRKH